MNGVVVPTFLDGERNNNGLSDLDSDIQISKVHIR